ncbi:MAG: ankyrin repeat domain-containing protein [Oligoflexia bacterium]|nr:ankyrin repeat domain-containing protein [Oligoflexia bacterium]
MNKKKLSPSFVFLFVTFLQLTIIFRFCQDVMPTAFAGTALSASPSSSELWSQWRWQLQKTKLLRSISIDQYLLKAPEVLFLDNVAKAKLKKRLRLKVSNFTPEEEQRFVDVITQNDQTQSLKRAKYLISDSSFFCKYPHLLFRALAERVISFDLDIMQKLSPEKNGLCLQVIAEGASALKDVSTRNSYQRPANLLEVLIFDIIYNNLEDLAIHIVQTIDDQEIDTIINRNGIGNGTLLMNAANAGMDRLVALLLSKGADSNYQYPHTRRTPLMQAVSGIKAKPFVVEMLLAAGSRVNDVDFNGNSALLEAAHCGHSSIVGLLLRHGADPRHRNSNGNTCLDKAQWSQNPQAIAEIENLLWYW